ncbi:MAG TPA: SRPBCC family protein [Candidatus Limnocylindrales bacterium]
MARIRYEVDGPVPPERFIAALTDFSDRRPDLWPGLDAKYFTVHELGDTWAEVTEGTDVLGGVWARERYDWSQPGLVRLTLVESPDFEPGTVTTYRIVPGPAGGCHVAVDFRRIARSPRGRLVGLVVQLTGARRFGGELRVALDRLARTAP